MVLRRITKILLFVALALQSLGAPAGDWKVHRLKDRMTDEISLFAYVIEKKSRAIFAVSEVQRDGQTAFVVALGPQSDGHKLKLLAERLRSNNLVMMLRIDDKRPHKLPVVSWGDDGANIAARIDNEILHEIAQGSLLLVQDPTNEIFEFSLQGSASSLNEALPSFSK